MTGFSFRYVAFTGRLKVPSAAVVTRTRVRSSLISTGTLGRGRPVPFSVRTKVTFSPGVEGDTKSAYRGRRAQPERARRDANARSKPAMGAFF
jgi:hypothetical protein